MKRSTTLLLFSTLSFFTLSANYYVNDADLSSDIYTSSIGSNTNDGLTPSTPKATLTNLLATYGPSGTNVLSSGDIIYVDAGSFLQTDANLSINVSGLSIIGAGSNLTFFNNNQASTNSNRWGNIIATNITIQGIYLTGYNYGLGDASTLYISGATGITINGVEVNENASGGGSSAIVINGGSSVTFNGGGSNCNPGALSVAGGGVNVEGNGNTVIFNDYTFSGNSKDIQGGSGLYISGDNTTTVSVFNSNISDNTNSSATGGAGIYVSGANLIVNGSCINGNQTAAGSGPKYGGAICVARGANVQISNCSFNNNSVSNSGKGGAISINTSFAGSGSAASVSIDSCSFSGNTASSEGNHLYLRVGSSNPASFTINECTFSSTAQDVRQDNSGIVTIQNSSSPSLSGSGITIVNTTLPSATPTTSCPAQIGPCFSVLPVELIEFTGECANNGIEFQWSTASERNNDHFLIEQLINNEHFQEVAQIPGNGNTQQLSNYRHLHATTTGETAYYRLSQYDIDGKATIFQTIAVPPCLNNSTPLTINYQNTSLRVTWDETTKSRTRFEVFNAFGQLLQTSITSPNQWIENKTTIQLRQPLSPGTYYCRLISHNQHITAKLLVSH